jgi:regulator of replication initiation timing
MKELFERILQLMEENVRLRVENEKLKEELKNERTLNNFRSEFPGKL